MKYFVTAEDPTCINGGTDNSLKKSQLEMILNTVSGSQVFATLVTPNHGRDMYITDGLETIYKPLKSYQNMFNAIEQGHIDDTGNIWANYSPCPICARALVHHYNKPLTNLLFILHGSTLITIHLETQ